MKISVFILFLFYTSVSYSQINGHNLLEYQFGQIPQDTKSFSSIYNRTVVNYSQQKVRLYGALEMFSTPYSDRNYTKLTQYGFAYKDKPFNLQVGNYYETIGRGILLRSYETPGAILEDASYRSRHYFHRDLFGFNSSYKTKKIHVKALYGKALNNVFAPSLDEDTRRSDIIEAIYADYKIHKQKVGLAALRLTNAGGSSVYSMVNAQGKLNKQFSYFTELAKNVSKEEIQSFTDNSEYALYANINYSKGNLGLTTEYKNYKNFVIGAGINEPPALIKEHTYRVLNRSTHVLQPFNESGFQFELYYSFKNSSSLVLNATYAHNDFGKVFNYSEYFSEYEFDIKDDLTAKVFLDYAIDEFKQESSRISSGFHIEKVNNDKMLAFDYESQYFSRNNEDVINQVVALTYQFSSKLIIIGVSEFSNDSYIIDSNNKIWLSSSVKYQLTPSNSMQLFVGERRGGPACNAGVCYEVLDFKGAELRFSSTF